MAPKTNTERKGMPSDVSTGNKARPSAKRRLKWWMLLVLLVFLPIAFGASVYVLRKPIAAFLVQSYLQRRGVAAVVEFDRLARGGFSAHIRLGPATPEFTAEIFDVTLDYTGPFAFPTIGTVKLVRPVLRASYDGQRFNLGTLQQLVEEALAKPPQEPGPNVSIEDGRLFVSTPYGVVQFGVAAKIDSGRLTSLDANLEPAALRGRGVTADIAGGTIIAGTVKQAVDARVTLKVNAVSAKSAMPFDGRGIDASADLRGIAWVSDNGRTDFSLSRGLLNIQSAAVTIPGFSAGDSGADLALENLQGSYRDAQLDFSLSAASLRIKSDAAKAAIFSVAQSDSSLALRDLKASYGKGKLRTTARTDLTTELTNLRADEGAAGKASLHVSLERAELDLSDHSWVLGGAAQLSLVGTNARYRLQNGDVAVRAVQAAFATTGSITDAGADGRLEGSFTAQANVPRRVALELVSAIPAAGTNPPIPALLADSLRDVNLRFPKLIITHAGADMTVAIPTPASLAGADGVRLAVSPQGRPLLHMSGSASEGAFGLDVSGGGLPELKLSIPVYRMRQEAGSVTLTASTQFDAKLNLPAFKNIHVSGSGEVDRRNGRLTFASLRCTDIDIGSLVGRDSTLVSQAKGQLCAEPTRPTLIADNAGWRVAGTWSGVSALFPLAQSAIASADGHIEFAGDATGPRSGHVTVDRALFSDSQPQPRFLPIVVSGNMDLAGTQWQGVLGLATHNRRFASASLRHEMQTGTGAASIEAKELSFEPGVFQPTDISSLLASAGTRVAGKAGFTGLVTWNDKGIQSSGRLHLMSVNLQTRFGAVRGVNGDFTLRSLMPIALAPSQTVAIDRLDWPVPVEQARLQFSLLPTEIQLEAATANAATGRISLDPENFSFAAGSTTAGALHLQNVDLTPLLVAAGLGERVKVAARIGGVVPFTYGPAGLRFANGRIAAEGPGRLSIPRQALVAAVGVGEGTQPPPNAVQDFAYQALENLAFDQLNGDVNSLPMGRLGLLLHIKGRHDPAQTMETRVGVVELLRGRAFDKPLPLPKDTPIDLTLDTSLNLDELLASYFASSGGAMAPPP